MCGIAGLVHADPDHPVEARQLETLLARLRHRGPDDEGITAEGSWGLIHTRLSILDLSRRARQPMTSRSGRYVLVYNGEIYNFRELRDALEKAGRRFDTTGDTEVVLELMETGGPAALERLEGMFAFALVDRERRELLLVRDRLGIKPLFYAAGPDGVGFASEPKGLPPGCTPAADPTPERVAEYLAFRHLAGEEDLRPGVRSLPPGHRLVTDGRSLRVERWWRPPAPGAGTSAETEARVAAAVRRQLVSDVPVGVYLSGGVDSALVTGAARDALPRLDTFTVGFGEPDWDESERARVVSDALGVCAHDLTLAADEFATELPHAIHFHDAPLNHANSVHLLALSRFARRHVTVALTGEGGDELFAGYPRYRLFLLARGLRGLPRGVRDLAHGGIERLRGSRPRWARLLEAAAHDAATAAAINPAFLPVDEAARLAGLEQPERAIEARRAIFQGARASGLGETESLLELERRTYLVSLLQRMDRMSMAAGLECRVPLLDEDVVGHALSLPVRARIDLRETKKPTRSAAARRFGRSHAYAPKSGFGVPLDAWLRGDGRLAKLLDGLLADRRTRARGWFDADLAQRRLAEHRAGERDRSEALWGLLNLELWARIAVDGDGPDGVLV